VPDTTTESEHDTGRGLDALSDAQALERLFNGQAQALDAVSQAFPDIAKGAALMSGAMRGTGRLIYAGAGSSALMASADGMELAGTFGIDPNRVLICMAGGLPQNAAMPGGSEDDARQAEVDASRVAADDLVIAVTASGSTPYAVLFAQTARSNGAKTICIANNPSAPIFDHADVAICLPTPPEVVAGSTRMGAGTAQKAALNMMSTLMGIRLGHVHDGMMVNLRADNKKLRNRAANMAARISGVSEDKARVALESSEWRVKQAVLRLAGAGNPEELLCRHKDRLRPALNEIETHKQISMEKT